MRVCHCDAAAQTPMHIYLFLYTGMRSGACHGGCTWRVHVGVGALLCGYGCTCWRGSVGVGEGEGEGAVGGLGSGVGVRCDWGWTGEPLVIPSSEIERVSSLRG